MTRNICGTIFAGSLDGDHISRGQLHKFARLPQRPPGAALARRQRPYGTGSQVVRPWCPRRTVNNQQPPTAAPCEPQRRWRPDPVATHRDTLVMRRSGVRSPRQLQAGTPRRLHAGPLGLDTPARDIPKARLRSLGWLRYRAERGWPPIIELANQTLGGQMSASGWGQTSCVSVRLRRHTRRHERTRSVGIQAVLETLSGPGSFLTPHMPVLLLSGSMSSWGRLHYESHRGR
jgi:hypothetical protein